MRVLVTGGAGYIGSHLLLQLLDAGLDAVVLDDFSTGHRQALARVQRLAGRSLSLVEGDLRDPGALGRALEGVEVVFHLAGLKRVDESLICPERYLGTNIGGTAALVEAMEQRGVRRLVFSSSAAVYAPASSPRTEGDPVGLTTPYGSTKLVGEGMLTWLAQRRGWGALSLRYFNPVGAHASACIGEAGAAPGNLVPRALLALQGRIPALTIHGTDYDTPDGTCVRDYLHVEDLAAAHLSVLSLLTAGEHRVFNVGTGRGASVRQVLAACEAVAGRPVPARDGPRREGDIPISLADPGLLERTAGFRARRGLVEMVASAWAWVRANPDGYRC